MKNEINTNKLIETFTDMANKGTLLASGNISQQDLLIQIVGTIAVVAMNGRDLKSIKEKKQAARNTSELLNHLVKIIEQNDDRFSFEWFTGGESAVMEIFDKEKKIGYAVKIEPIEYDENGEAVNL